MPYLTSAGNVHISRLKISASLCMSRNDLQYTANIDFWFTNTFE